jgi:hypothetical protein
VSPVPAGHVSAPAGVYDAGGTGAVFGGPVSPIDLVCSASTPSTFAIEADLTATMVSSVNGAVVKSKPAHPTIFNHFKPGLGRFAARHAASQTRH